MLANQAKSNQGDDDGEGHNEDDDVDGPRRLPRLLFPHHCPYLIRICLLYTSDAADE